MNTCASIKRLMEIKDVTEEDAKLIRAVWKAEKAEDVVALYPPAHELFHKRSGEASLWRLKCMAIDKIIGAYGVEHLGELKYRGRDGAQFVNYCNAGDAYTATIVFIGGNRLVVNCWGHYVEKGLIHDPEKRRNKWD